jgi:hypothetical protein
VTVILDVRDQPRYVKPFKRKNEKLDLNLKKNIPEGIFSRDTPEKYSKRIS